MPNLKEQIIAEYQKTKKVEVTPSFAFIALKCRTTKQYAWQVIQEWKKNKKGKAGQI